ncbi:sugar-binding transcriptional regulator [Diaminobutyricibacter sp. McL0608]|uniref:sugar-binding transcriptional regulator n=1 Tax=Leifsonia sp. McL0608 TaxID=3143537 RepID=UPI0031F3074C
MSIGNAEWSRLPADRMSLLTKVARMYHEQHIRQPEIAQRLHISQSRVSRLLKEAVNLGVVRTIVVSPPGVHSQLEDAIRDRYGLADVVVGGDDSGLTDDDNALLATLGSAGAAYLETTLSEKDDIGVSSWSSTLLAVVDAMTPQRTRLARSAVQLLGGVGDPSVQVKATHLTDRLARVTGAEARYFPAPGIVARKSVRDALLEDPYVSEVASAWDGLSVALVGIGSLRPSPLLQSSGNAISEKDQDSLRELGAVGDVCLHFFDAGGALVDSELEDRVIGISSKQLRAIPRTIGIAGGARKVDAIRAAALGGWIDVLITDVETARRLVD